MDDESARSRPSTANAPEPAAAVQQRLAYDRTYLANERTYAAWLRTGLAVAAGGIAIAHLVPEPSRHYVPAFALGTAFVLLGVTVMAYGAWQFVAIARKIAEESGRPVGGTPRFAFILTLIIAALLLAVLYFFWLQRQAPLIAR